MDQNTKTRTCVTTKNFKEFKKAWLAAVNNDEARFIFEGHDVLTAYAKYLVEYWEASHGGGR